MSIYQKQNNQLVELSPEILGGGGPTLYNSEEWITESGTWTAPVTGWYSGEMWAGGWSGSYTTNRKTINAGPSGASKKFFVYLQAGQQVPVTIGAGGQSGVNDPGGAVAQYQGGLTSFGNITVGGVDVFDEPGKVGVGRGVQIPGSGSRCFESTPNTLGFVFGGGHGGCWIHNSTVLTSGYTQEQRDAAFNAFGCMGGGGGAGYYNGYGGGGSGAPGSIYLTWYDSSKSAVPVE